MWDSSTLSINDIVIIPQVIHVSAKVNDLSLLWFLSVVYASNLFEDRKILWNNLSIFVDSIKNLTNNSYLIGGDFNKVIKASKKFSGNAINNNRVACF